VLPRAYKDVVYEQLARLGKAASAPRRLELLDLLAQGPRTVEALAAETGLTVANASQHLQVLRRARLVDAEKMGLFVEYRLADPHVERFLFALRGLARARLVELEQVTRRFLEERDAFEPVDRERLLRRVLSGDVTIVDVRPSASTAPATSRGPCRSRSRSWPRGSASCRSAAKSSRTAAGRTA
jgi:DNA-binding transcriptional ArsR family regulator